MAQRDKTQCLLAGICICIEDCKQSLLEKMLTDTQYLKFSNAKVGAAEITFLEFPDRWALRKHITFFIFLFYSIEITEIKTCCV